MSRTLLSEDDWMKMKVEYPGMRLKKNKVTFWLYGTVVELPMKGRLTVVLQNKKGKAVKAMAYVVEGQSEFFLWNK